MRLTPNEFAQHEHYKKLGKEKMRKAVALQQEAHDLFTEADGYFHRTLLFSGVKSEIRNRIAYARQNPFDAEKAIEAIDAFIKGSAWMVEAGDDLRLYLLSGNFLSKRSTPFSIDALPGIRDWAAKNLPSVNPSMKGNPLKDKIGEAFDAYAVHVLAKFYAPTDCTYETEKYSDFTGGKILTIPRSPFTIKKTVEFNYGFFGGKVLGVEYERSILDSDLEALGRLFLVVYNYGRKGGQEIYTRGGLPNTSAIAKSVEDSKKVELVSADITIGENNTATLTLNDYNGHGSAPLADKLNAIVARYYDRNTEE